MRTLYAIRQGRRNLRENTHQVAECCAVERARDTVTAMPFNCAMPESGSIAVGPSRTSRFELTPVVCEATESPMADWWPQPCGKATVPGIMSVVRLSGTLSAPAAE